MKILAGMNRRDKSLLVVLLVAVIFYVCYTFIMAPNMDAIKILKQEKVSVDSDIARAREVIKNKPQLEILADDTKRELISKYSVFFTDPDQAQLLYKLDTLMVESGIYVSAYTPLPEVIAKVPIEQGEYSEPEYNVKDLAKEISPGYYKDRLRKVQSAGSGGEDMGADIIPGTYITFGFERSSYDNINGFLKGIEDMQKTTALRSINMEKSGAGIGGDMTVAFYSLPALDERQKDYLNFVPVVPKDKTDPFN